MFKLWSRMIKSIFIVFVFLFSFSAFSYRLTNNELIDTSKIVELKAVKIIRALEAKKEFGQAELVAEKIRNYIIEQQIKSKQQSEVIQERIDTLLQDHNPDLPDEEKKQIQREISNLKFLLSTYEHRVSVVRKILLARREEINKQIESSKNSIIEILLHSEQLISNNQNDISTREQWIESTIESANSSKANLRLDILSREEWIESTIKDSKEAILAEEVSIKERESNVRETLENAEEDKNKLSKDIQEIQLVIDRIYSEANLAILDLQKRISESTNPADTLIMKEQLASIRRMLADKSYKLWNTKTILENENEILKNQNSILLVIKKVKDGTYKVWNLPSLNDLYNEISSHKERIQRIHEMVADGTYKTWNLPSLNNIRTQISSFRFEIEKINTQIAEGTYKTWNLPSLNEINNEIILLKEQVKRIKEQVIKRDFKMWNSEKLSYYDDLIKSLLFTLAKITDDFNQGVWEELFDYPKKIAEIKDKLKVLGDRLGLDEEYHQLNADLELLNKYTSYIPNIKVLIPEIQLPFWLKTLNFVDKAYTTTSEFLKFRDIYKTARKMNPVNVIDYIIRNIPGFEGKGLFERIGKVILPKKWMENPNIITFWKDLDSKKLFQGLVRDNINVGVKLKKTLKAIDALKNKSYEEFLKITDGAREVQEALNKIPGVSEMISAVEKTEDLRANVEAAFDNLEDMAINEIDTAVNRSLDPILDTVTDEVLDRIFPSMDKKLKYIALLDVQDEDQRIEKIEKIRKDRINNPENYEQNLDRIVLYFMKDTLEMELGHSDHFLHAKLRDLFIKKYIFLNE